jgi:PST family polysaccharide transporter
MLGLADPLTRVMFGPGWAGIAALFASLAIAGFSLPLTNVATWVFYSLAHGTAWLRTALALAGTTVIAYVVGTQFGLVGMALTFSINVVLVQQSILYFIVGRNGPVPATDLWLRMLRYLPLWAIVAASSYLALGFVSDLAAPWQLLACAPVGLLSGALYVWLVTPLRQSALTLLRTVLASR